MNRAVFLDRDGTIIEEVGYLNDPGKMQLLPYSCSSIKTLNQNGFYVIVISNQSGVARGYFSEEQVHIINQKLQEKLRQKEAHIDAFYFCPHHPQGSVAKYRMICNCRKPNIGLLKQAAKNLKLNLSQCYFVGDKETDVLTSNNAGCKTVLVLTGYGKTLLESKPDFQEKVDFVAENLTEGVKWILKDRKINE